MESMIWGCGEFGKLAYHYYRECSNIAGFIDSVPEKWGNTIFDKIIYPPEVLKTFKGIVIIAIQNYLPVAKMLEHINSTLTAVVFSVSEKTLSNQFFLGADSQIDGSTIMMYFCGGLGNQMFQYALAKNYLVQDKKVLANIEHYLSPRSRQFILCDVFPNIVLNFGSETHKQKIIELNKTFGGEFKDFRIFKENTQNGKVMSADMSLLNITGGIISGYYLNYIYAQNVEYELRKDFVFKINKESKLAEAVKTIQNCNCVSVHIRRGDYLKESNYKIYGNICTIQYYKAAMSIMKSKLDSCVFCFFSDDIEWVKEQFGEPSAMYIESSMFEHYEDWYDMYLMSQCKHNILANSTFSWWGAWLNPNKDKIVIAPQKIVNSCKYIDLYPEKWIRLDNHGN